MVFERSYKPQNILKGGGVYKNTLQGDKRSLCCSPCLSSHKSHFRRGSCPICPPFLLHSVFPDTNSISFSQPSALLMNSDYRAWFFLVFWFFFLIMHWFCIVLSIFFSSISPFIRIYRTSNLNITEVHLCVKTDCQINV